MQREKIYYKSKSFVGLIIGFVLAAVMLLPTLAEADDSFTVEYKSENISVHGNTAVPYATVIIFVVPSDTELDSITENSANEKKFIAAAVNANETGDYSFSGVMPSWCVSGEYAVYAIYNGDKKNKNFFHINSERAMIAIFGNEENVGINGCNSYQEVKELLDSGYSTDLGIVEVNDDVAKMIFAGRPETGYTLDGFTSEYNSIKTIISIRKCDNNDEIEDIIKSSATYLDLDYDAGYKDLDSKCVEKHMEYLKSDDVENTSSKEFFYQSLVLASVKTLSSPAEIQAVIEKNNKYLGIDLTYYDKLNNFNQGNIISDLMKINPTGFESIKANIESLSKKKYESASTSAGGSLGGSPGSKDTSFEVKGDIEKIAEKNQIQIKSPFNDMDNHWSSESVYELKNRGIISGYSDGSFKPDQNMTRAEFTKIICLAFKLDVVNGDSFSDVNKTDWYYPYIYTAYSEQIVNGFGDTFKPDDKISRQDCAVIIYRALAALGKTTNVQKTESFIDEVQIADYATQAVQLLKEKGYIRGTNNMFNPQKNITRAEVSTMIYNVLGDL